MAPKMEKIEKDVFRFIPGHENSYRRLTARECARLQTFPDDYYFESTSGKPSRTDAFKQIGNAVPIGLAKAIGEAVISVANGDSVVQIKRFRGTGIHNRIKSAIEFGTYSGTVANM